MKLVNFGLGRLTGVLIILSAVLLVATAGSVSAQTSVSMTLTVKVVDARNAKGTIGVALFHEPTGFSELCETQAT